MARPSLPTGGLLFLAAPCDNVLTDDARLLAAALHAALGVRDASTGAHCRRVAAYAARLFAARTRGSAHPLDMERLEVLETGALLHDVGKLFVAHALLTKPGTLTPHERRDMEAHPALGEAVCRHSGTLDACLPIVRHHHERWDGEGYPDSLRGLDIPYLARLVAVVDVYDALTAARPYRHPLAYHEARAILLGGRGTQFDPDLLDVWCEVPASEWARLGRACCDALPPG